MPPAVLARARRRLGLADAVVCYGMTETSPVSCMTAPGDGAAAAGSVGRPLPHTGVKVVSPADRVVVVPVGARGELAAAGYLVMRGYWGDEAGTAAVRVREPGGGGGVVWLYSGDEAVMGRDGRVAITGRIKDLIIRGGENIRPREFEDCLFALPGVAACVVPARGWATAPDDARDAAADRALTPAHLVPKHVLWAADLPKTASGKVQKFKLRDWAARSVADARRRDRR